MPSLVPQTKDNASNALFRSSCTSFAASGIRTTLPTGTLDTLGARVRGFFASSADEGPHILLGSLPFDRSQTDYLFQPEEIVDYASRLVPLPVSTGRWHVTESPSAQDYGAMVARALDAIAGATGLDKIVLARRLVVETNTPLDPHVVVDQLGKDPSITAFAMPLPAGVDGTPRTLVGGTPELLLEKSGRTVRSNPLAGSARRQADPIADTETATALEKSDKNRREHSMVVEAIMDTLAPYCDQLNTPAFSTLHSTASMWHLGSRIEGTVRDADISCADLVALVHPTPAVCGFPRDRAQALIRELEPFDRGFYAGAVGWADSKGDGEWHIALRCGEICDRQITLYAGAGIVSGSDPVAETDETMAKFQAFLRALGIDEHGQVRRENRA